MRRICAGDFADALSHVVDVSLQHGEPRIAACSLREFLKRQRSSGGWLARHPATDPPGSGFPGCQQLKWDAESGQVPPADTNPLAASQVLADLAGLDASPAMQHIPVLVYEHLASRKIAAYLARLVKWRLTQPFRIPGPVALQYAGARRPLPALQCGSCIRRGVRPAQRELNLAAKLIPQPALQIVCEFIESFTVGRHLEAHQESPSTTHEDIFFGHRESPLDNGQSRVLQQVQKKRPRSQTLGLRLPGCLHAQDETLDAGEVTRQVHCVRHVSHGHNPDPFTGTAAPDRLSRTEVNIRQTALPPCAPSGRSAAGRPVRSGTSAATGRTAPRAVRAGRRARRWTPAEAVANRSVRVLPQRRS